MPAAELAERMPLDEFFEHWAEYMASPWGEERADLRNGVLAAMLFNIHRGRDQAAKGAADFILYRAAESEEDARAVFIRQQQRRR